MPSLSVWVVRAAFLYLVAGAGLGSALLVAKAVPIELPWSALRALHIEFLAFGWTANLAMGIAHWIFPRTPTAAIRRHSTAMPFIALNLGIAVIVLGSLLQIDSLATPARLVQLAGGMLFAHQIRSRIPPPARPSPQT